MSSENSLCRFRAHFLIGLLIFLVLVLSSMHILDTKLPPVVELVQMFPFFRLPLRWLTVFFAIRNLFILWSSTYCCCSFLGDQIVIQKVLTRTYIRKYTSHSFFQKLWSFRSNTESLAPLGIVCVQGERQGLIFILIYPGLPTPSAKDSVFFFLRYMFLVFLFKIRCPWEYELIFETLILFCWSVCLYVCFCGSSLLRLLPWLCGKRWKQKPWHIFFFNQDCFSYPGHFVLPYEF